MLIQFSPDNRRMASTSLINNGVVWLSDPASGARVATLAGHARLAHEVTFRPDSQLVATAGFEEKVHLWTADGAATGELTGHTGNVADMMFTRDGAHLIVTSNTEVRIWDPVRGEPVEAPFTGHAKQIVDVVLSADGTTLATAGEDGSVQLWDLGYLADPYGAICAQLGPPARDELKPYLGGAEMPAVCAGR